MHEEMIAKSLGALTFIGGAAGYIRSKSIPSLVAGFSFGSALLLASEMIKKDIGDTGDARFSYGIAAGSSAILAATMGMRYNKTGKPMPALPLLAGGSICTAYYLYKIKQRTDEEREENEPKSAK
eukprot:c20975_g1_i1.p1 GENE.c20975_g1_i1~~c20975_g1_i1.p1  ORF type:complete len:137 (+),score=37.44 c20975_g1_i1:37-411(+)